MVTFSCSERSQAEIASTQIETGRLAESDTESDKSIKVLLIAEQCNPDWTSVPLVAWNYFQELDQLTEVTLVTHERNAAAIQKRNCKKVIYIPESRVARLYFALVAKLLDFLFKGKDNWPLYHLLTYPIYFEFNRQVDQLFAAKILAGEYDVVHAITPMMPRYPVKVVRACCKTPFVIGPVNGGVPFPAAFADKAREEFAYLNFLRTLGRWLIPGYAATYTRASKILVGSTYTLKDLAKQFRLAPDKLLLHYENGISQQFFSSYRAVSNSESGNSDSNLEQCSEQTQPGAPIAKSLRLIFVGRLVPYKCADIVVEAISRLDLALQQQLTLTIVGEGSEKAKLEAQVKALGLEHIVQFTGWVAHAQILQYYRQADIFCFPSIREFGGAVVLEAMACGLPCIVVNNGGIGEYVTEATGFKIEPLSRDYLVKTMADKISVLQDPQLRWQMGQAATTRAQEFTWKTKAQKIVALYKTLQAQQSGTLSQLPIPAANLRQKVESPR